jgi:phage shock protein PspC (stress-responsive transcriptional regulator)
VSEINLEHTARDFWATRPRRRKGDRKIAGVAAAIGRRYAIDPILVRVAFVVATFAGGAGVLLYLLGWLLLPVEGDQSDGAESVSGRGQSSMPALLTIVLVLVLMGVAGALLSDPSGVIGLAAGLGALLLLHRARASLGEIPGSSAPAGPVSQPAPATATATETPAGEASEPVPPAWDPLGAAPFAWDLPEPSAPPEPTTPHWAQSKITPITLGLALLAGGTFLAFTPSLSAAQVAAMLLGVVGLGLVVGSFIQGGRGLIAVAIPLALLTGVLSAAPSSDLTAGNRHWDAVTAAQVQPRYALNLGNGYLDLSRLQLSDDQVKQTRVDVGIGQTHVLLPPNADVDVTCRSELGDVECLGERDDNGHPSLVSVTNNYGRDGRPGGGKLILDVRAGAGQVHVDRAS